MRNISGNTTSARNRAARPPAIFSFGVAVPNWPVYLPRTVGPSSPPPRIAWPFRASVHPSSHSLSPLRARVAPGCGRGSGQRHALASGPNRALSLTPPPPPCGLRAASVLLQAVGERLSTSSMLPSPCGISAILVLLDAAGERLVVVEDDAVNVG
eukprot:scaffold4905_cov121-Isochrysis_galbana.AAC.1